MNKIIVAILACVGAFSITFGANICDEKVANLQKQIDLAKELGNTNKLDGLNAALANVKSKCNGEGVVKKLKSEVSKYEKKVDKAKADVAKAKAKGNALKTKGEEAKLKLLEADLDKAKKRLNDHLIQELSDL